MIGKTVPDISLNAVANLGYAEFAGACRSIRRHAVGAFDRAGPARELQPGEWRGLVRSTGTNQNGEMVLDYVRWVMVHKRDPRRMVGPAVSPKRRRRWRRST